MAVLLRDYCRSHVRFDEFPVNEIRSFILQRESMPTRKVSAVTALLHASGNLSTTDTTDSILRVCPSRAEPARID
jgi:hypothetical protein